MSLGRVSTAIAIALAISSAPAFAAGQSVRAADSSLAVQSVGKAKAGARKGVALKQANEAKAGGVVMGIAAAGLAVTAVVLAVDNDDDDATSP